MAGCRVGWNDTHCNCAAALELAFDSIDDTQDEARHQFVDQRATGLTGKPTPIHWSVRWMCYYSIDRTTDRQRDRLLL